MSGAVGAVEELRDILLARLDLEARALRLKVRLAGVSSPITVHNDCQVSRHCRSFYSLVLFHYVGLDTIMYMNILTANS